MAYSQVRSWPVYYRRLESSSQRSLKLCFPHAIGATFVHGLTTFS